MNPSPLPDPALNALEPILDIVGNLVKLGWPGIIAGVVIFLGFIAGYIWITNAKNKAAKERSDAEAAKGEASNPIDNQEIERKQKEAQDKIEEARRNNPDEGKQERPR